jgi:hypothetical protein
MVDRALGSVICHACRKVPDTGEAMTARKGGSILSKHDELDEDLSGVMAQIEAEARQTTS